MKDIFDGSIRRKPCCGAEVGRNSANKRPEGGENGSIDFLMEAADAVTGWAHPVSGWGLV